MTLKEWIKKNHLPTSEIANLLGVTRCTIYLWLNKKQAPSYKNYLKVKLLTKGEVSYEEIFKNSNS